MVSNEDMNSAQNSNSAKNSNSSTSSSIDSENSSDFDSNVNGNKTIIRVGVEYQADLQNYSVKKKPNLSEIHEKEMLVWKPCSSLSNEDLDSYLFTACSKCSYSIEQALALLCINKHDIQVSLMNTNHYVPTPNEWSEEDKIIFEQAYNYHGKNFYKIKQCLPDKSQASLVNFYYMWKKQRANVSHIQQLTEQQQSGKNNSNQNSEASELKLGEDGDLTNQNQIGDNDGDDADLSDIAKICSNCDTITDDLQSMPKGALCNLCYVYYKNTSGLMRPDNVGIVNGAPNGDFSDSDQVNQRAQNAKEARNFQKSLRKPPKGIYLNYDELVNLAEFDYNFTFDTLDKKLFSLKQEVQANKQLISKMIGELAGDDDNKNNVIEIDNDLLQALEAKSIPTPSWTSHEITLVLQGFNKYGTDFSAISQVIGSKSESSVKSFYQYHKDNYNLEKLIANPNDLKLINESLTSFNENYKPTAKQEEVNVFEEKSAFASNELLN